MDIIDGRNMCKSMEFLNKRWPNQKSPIFPGLDLCLQFFMSDLISVFGVYLGEGWQILGGLQKHAGQLDVLL